MSIDQWELANRVDLAVDRIFESLPNDLARVRNELHGLRRLTAAAREGTNSYVTPPEDFKLDITKIHVRDVLLRSGESNEFWKVLRVRRHKHMVDVVAQDGRQRIYNLCEFSQHWSEADAQKLNLSWRY